MIQYLKNYNKLLILLIYSLWLLSLVILYYNLGSSNLNLLHTEYGVAMGGDTGRYVRAAEQIILINFPHYPEGVADINNAQGYMGYNIFLAILFLLNLNFFSIVIVQIVLSGIAALALYRIGKIIWSENVGLLSMFIFLFYSPIQIFNFYILTESLFISLLIIGFYALIVDHKKNNLIIGTLILVFAAFTRPFGIVIIPLLFIYYFLILLKFKKKKLILILILISSFLLILTFLILDQLIILLGIPEMFLRGDIIWNYNSVSPPYNFDLVQTKDLNIFGVLGFIFNYPLYFFKVFVIKLFWFFLRARPFYSDMHNLFLIFSSFILYFFSIVSFFYNNNRKETIYFMVLFVFATAISVLLTVVDWDARFSLPILPFIFLFASAGFCNLLKKIFDKN